jgi:hypothetical protein
MKVSRRGIDEITRVSKEDRLDVRLSRYREFSCEGVLMDDGRRQILEHSGMER